MIFPSRSCALVLAAGLVGAGAAAAQSRPTDAGTFQLAGTAQLSRHRSDLSPETTTVFELAPRVGYFVVQGLALSANLSYSRISAGGIATNAWGLGPGLTYYPGRLSPRVYPFISGRTLFTWQRTPGDFFTPALHSHSTSWLVSGGGLFLLADHVGLTGEFFYQRDQFTFEFSDSGPSAPTTSESWGLQWGVAVFVK